MTAEVTTGAIDVHGHCVPREFLDEVVRHRPYGVEAELTEEKYLLTFPGRKPLRPISGAMIDSADRTGWFAHQRIAHQIVCPWLDVHGQELPGADGAAWVRLLNDAVAASVAPPDRGMSGYAAVHLADPHAAADELRRCVEQLGMRGAMVPASQPFGRLSDPGYDALWSVAEQLQSPIVLHPATNAPTNDLAKHYPMLGGLFGRQLDSTLSAAELILAGVFDRFPELRLVIVHGGGFLPYQAARFDRDAKAAGGAGLPPSDVVRLLYYDTVLMSAEALRFLYDYVGGGRVMIGSDYGAGAADRSGVMITEATRRSSDDPNVVDAVLAGNARALFGLA